MAHFSTRETQFAYFDQVLGRPSWQGREILDFGGNVGGFLAGAGERVDHRRYWCLDVDREALERGRRRFPNANFLHFDRYSSEFNPRGIRRLPVPDCGTEFDLILAFSVFTHTHQSEMLELVPQLRSLLAPGGRLAFTFCDPGYDRSRSNPDLPPGTDVRKHLEWQRARNPSLDESTIESTVERARRARWCLLIDHVLYVEPDDSLSHQVRRGRAGESYCSYFEVSYIQSLLPQATIVDPIPPEWQHCCVLPGT